MFDVRGGDLGGWIMINLDLNVWYGCVCFVFSCALSYYLGPKGEKLLVFDYMPKGSLALFLHGDVFFGVGPLAISAAKIVKLIWKEISSLTNLLGRLSYDSHEVPSTEPVGCGPGHSRRVLVLLVIADTYWVRALIASDAYWVLSPSRRSPRPSRFTLPHRESKSLESDSLDGPRPVGRAKNIAAAAAAAAATLQPQPLAPVEIDWMSRFQKNEPQRFEGGYNPDGAQRWLQDIEKIFRSLQPPYEYRVRLAEFVLASEAEHWWEQQSRGLEVANEAITWDLFQTRFLGKYFPEDVRREKELAFLKLEQRNLSVGEYAAQFEDLIRYSGSYRDADERTKCIKFESGLHDDIRLAFEYQNVANLSQLVNMASTYEKGLKRKADGKRSRSAQKAVGPIRGKGGVQRSAPYVNPSSRVSTTPRSGGEMVVVPGPYPICQHCGRQHREECWSLDPNRARGSCFRCGKPGHFAARCTENVVKEEVNVAKAQQAGVNRPMQRGKVYTMDGEEPHILSFPLTV
ncbi:hypothetical protein RIF29_10027 [Crotalaria pallida]|uniref:CCHC-type domain-containing protein n=1 Tax=Crotalaria pallida TaxID=3830 RepID=A0AAN9II69_CROPI